MTSLNPQTLVDILSAHPRAEYLRNLWKSARQFEKLPLMRPRDLATVPLEVRTIETGPSVVASAYSDAAAFPVRHLIEDMRRDRYPENYTRCMIALTHTFSTLAVALALYARGVVPITVDGRNEKLANMLAESFEPECVYASLDTSFKSDTARICVLNRFTDFQANAPSGNAVIVLAEAGLVAHRSAACSARTLHAAHDTLIECINGEIAITRLHVRATPLVRYAPTVRGKVSLCACGMDGLLL